MAKLFTMANFRLAVSVSTKITDEYLMGNPDWNPFMSTKEDVQLLPNDYIVDRYTRCCNFMDKCYERAEQGLFPELVRYQYYS